MDDKQPEAAPKNEKRPYHTPSLVTYGDLARLTQAIQNGVGKNDGAVTKKGQFKTG